MSVSVPVFHRFCEIRVQIDLHHGLILPNDVFILQSQCLGRGQFMIQMCLCHLFILVFFLPSLRTNSLTLCLQSAIFDLVMLINIVSFSILFFFFFWLIYL